MARTRRFISMVLVALCAAAGSMAAQTTGTLTGTVKDAQGAVVPGATVSLTSDTRGTSAPDVVTDGTGNFTFVNLPADTYTAKVVLPGFKTLRRGSISVSPGDQLSLPLTIEVGGATEEVTVTAEQPLVQTQSGERSMKVTTESVQALPIANRSFTGLATLAPGVIGTSTGQQGDTAVQRVGGGGANNIVMDGMTAVDTGSNSPLIQTSVESIQEVKVLISNYQAEYGRFSGLQISAITKSGSNTFHGSLYDVERNSRWNNNSQTSILNGEQKATLKARDWGYTIGGPVGRAGGNNKLFFFYAQEYAPRTGGNDTVRFRMPTALERNGDFSKTLDQNGALYNLIRDTSIPGAVCSTSNTSGCFADGGVLGRIPQNRLYQPGMNILKMFPTPNAEVPGLAYNYVITRPEEKAIATQPVFRLDYQASQSLRGTFKYTGWIQKNDVIAGTIPGYNDVIQPNPRVYTFSAQVAHTINNTTFLEVLYGKSYNELAGCAFAQGSGFGGGNGPSFCRNGLSVSPLANRFTAGLGGLPLLFPNAEVIDPRYYTYEALSKSPTTVFDGKQIVIPPTFQWGNRVANANVPPVPGFPGYLTPNRSQDFSINLTKLVGRHTFKVGYYNGHTYKAQTPAGWQGTINFGNATTNPLDSTFGFANAALGIFSSYAQQNKYVEGNLIYNNREAFIQDNWRVSNRLTLDYGMRFIHQQPAHDGFQQGVNFVLDQFNRASMPRLYVAGCANGAVICSGTTRQAYDPVTKTFLGPNTTAAIGTVVPNTGDALNGLVPQGTGMVPDTLFSWPKISLAPRFGAAYDVGGRQKYVLRGGAGIFYDRPAGNVCTPCQNPPTSTLLTVQNANLQSLGSGLSLVASPVINAVILDAGLPSSAQWNGGIQIALSRAMAIDVEYVGQHAYNTQQNVNINSVDLGAAFLAANQDATLGAPASPGANAISSDQMRNFRGYGNITQVQYIGWRTSHSLQLSLNRRARSGLGFGFNDTIPFYDHTSQAPRLQHNPDGTYSVRDDQAKAEELLGTSIANRNIMKANAVWNLPSLRWTGNKQILGLLASDWQVSGIWTGVSGGAYNVTASIPSTSAVNISGSPDFGTGRVIIVGDPGNGCNSDDPYKQFNTAAFAPPKPGSDGLESGAGYLRGCFLSTFDLSFARNIRLGLNKSVQLRVDAFNVFNNAAITGRNTQMSVTSLTDSTVTNLPYDAAGNLITTRSTPANAGFGVANTYQNPRNIQIQVRFGF